MEHIRYPHIDHLNGTGREGLVRQHEKAWQAINLAVDALALCAPHGRDWQDADHESLYRDARIAHNEQMALLRDIQAEQLRSVQV